MSGTFSKKNIDHIKRNGKYESTTVIQYITQGNFNEPVDGQNGITCYLSHTSKVFEGDTDRKAVIGQRDNVEIIAYSGTQRLDTFIDVSTGITGLIEGVLDASIYSNGTKATNVTFSIDSSLYDASGNISIPVFIYISSEEDTSVGDSSAWYQPSEQILSMTLTYDWIVNQIGVSNYRLDLSNEAMAINCDSSGNYLQGSALPSCKATLYYGNTDCSTAWYTISAPSAQSLTGVTIDASGNFIFNGSTLAFNGNSVEITVTAKISNQTYGVAIATLMKNIPGRDGSIGQDAVNYWLSLSCDAVHVNPNSTTLVADPSTMTAVVYKQVGAQTPVVDSSCTIKYGYNTTSPSTTYSSAITINANKSYISFGAYLNNVLVDGIETVPILRDGVNGQSAYRLDLTNENAGINADSSGNILSGAQKPTCTAKLYLGNTVVSGVTYAISTSATGVSINSSSGVLTFGNNFTFSGTSVEITVTAKIGSTLYGTAIMTVSKNIAGTNGSNGRDGSTGRDGSAGADAVTYWLNLSADAVTVDTNNNNSFAPNKIRVKAMKQVGAQTPVTASEATIYYAYDNTPTTSSSTVTNDSSITVNITNHDELYVALWVSGTQRDLETIPILRNGTNGAQGTQGTQGAQGYSGIIYRRSVWAEDVSASKVLRNDSAVQTYDNRYIDLVFNKNNVLINDSTLKLYRTKVTHTASNSIPLTNTTYFEEIPITSEFYAANIFAGQLSADVIDVGTIKVTDLADINNLVVKQINSNNNTFIVDANGNMTATSGTFYGNVRIPLTTIDVGYYGSSSDAYYLSNTTASNFVLSYGYTSSTSEKYVRVILPSPSSTYNGTSYFFLMPPKSGSTTDTSQLAGVKILTSSGTRFYNYSSLGASTQGCSAMIFGPGTCRLLCDGSNWYCIESTSHMRLYYSSAWHDVHEVQSDSISNMTVSNNILYLS